MSDAQRSSDEQAAPLDDLRHTPGPWLIARSAVESTDIHISGKNPEWENFASVIVRMAEAAMDDPEGWANARLIAAAPDLLEALRLLVDETADEKPRGWIIACEAIAKAEGRS